MRSNMHEFWFFLDYLSWEIISSILSISSPIVWAKKAVDYYLLILSSSSKDIKLFIFFSISDKLRYLYNILCFAHNLELLIYNLNCFCFHCFSFLVHIFNHSLSYSIHFLVVLVLFWLDELLKGFVHLEAHVIVFLNHRLCTFLDLSRE